MKKLKQAKGAYYYLKNQTASAVHKTQKGICAVIKWIFFIPSLTIGTLACHPFITFILSFLVLMVVFVKLRLYYAFSIFTVIKYILRDPKQILTLGKGWLIPASALGAFILTPLIVLIGSLFNKIFSFACDYEEISESRAEENYRRKSYFEAEMKYGSIEEGDKAAVDDFRRKLEEEDEK